MNERGQAELTLLQRWFPALEYAADGDWVLLRDYPLPDGWAPSAVSIAFQIPAGLPGQQPYAFYVSPAVTHNGSQPQNYNANAAGVPLAGTWAQFSWAPVTWQPHDDPVKGDNLVSFARSIAQRFAEGA